MILRRIEPLSFAKIAGLLYAVMGFIGGLFMWMFSGVMSGIGGAEMDAFAAFFGMGALITLPILYGIMGFIFGFIGAWLYNLVADRIGGIEVDLA